MEIGSEDVECIHLALNKDQLKASVDTAMNLS
jgi:hypothetical protein